MKKPKKNYKYERDLAKERIMLKKGVITIEEIRSLWYEKNSF